MKCALWRRGRSVHRRADGTLREPGTRVFVDAVVDADLN